MNELFFFYYLEMTHISRLTAYTSYSQRFSGRRHYLNPQLIKSYMWQLMKALDHMHKKGIFHRDIKPENILIESSTEIGRGLKLADFGSCRGMFDLHGTPSVLDTPFLLRYPHLCH
jgi:serine/threonine protein kinase